MSVPRYVLNIEKLAVQYAKILPKQLVIAVHKYCIDYRLNFSHTFAINVQN